MPEFSKRKGSNAAQDEASATRPPKRTKVALPVESTNINTVDDLPASSSAEHSLNLNDLLDFTSLEDDTAISNRFDEIARVLMHEHQLVVHHDGADTAFEIQEMEFYLQKAECHEDPFTHGSEEQKISGRWYFHRSPRRSNDASRSSTSLTSYRGGSRKGMDLTIGRPPPRTVSPHFGQPAGSSLASNVAAVHDNQHGTKSDELLRGGILLRSLRSLNKGGTTDKNSKSSSVHGPSLLVDRILSLSGAESISELVETIWGGDTSALNPPSASSTSSRTSYLYLKRVIHPASVLPQIHKSPRIGLDLSHPGTTVPDARSTLIDCHPRIRFLPKMLRYYTRPRELTKGRAQSIYGFIHKTLATRPDFQNHSLSADKAFRAILTEAMGVKDALAERYLREYDAGRKGGHKHLKLCIGPSGKGAADSPTSYLKMMGAFDAVLL